MTAARLILLVDTSLAGARLGLMQSGSGELLWSGGSDETQGSAARLPALLTAGLDSIGEQIPAIAGVVVSTGPGSFTGIRVGIAFAKGVAAGLGVPVSGCSSLGLLARAYATQDGTRTALFLGATATHGYVAFADQGQDASGLLAAAAGHVPWPSTWDVGEVRGHVDSGFPVRICGGWAAMEKHLVDIGVPFSILPVSPLADRAVAVMGQMAAMGVVHTGFADRGGYIERQLEPVYLRRSSVEEKLAGVGDLRIAAPDAGGAV